MRSLAEVLADLLGPKSTDAIEAEAEDEAVFLTQSHVEAVVLDGYCTTIPRIAKGRRRTNQRVCASSGSFLEIEKE